jgi:hypothetical protein
MLHEFRKTPLIKSRERCRTSRSPALPATLAHRSLTSLCENLVKISAKVVRQAATSFYRRLRSSCRRPVPPHPCTHRRLTARADRVSIPASELATKSPARRGVPIMRL